MAAQVQESPGLELAEHLGIIVPPGGLSISEVLSMVGDIEDAGFGGIYVTEAWRSAFVSLTAIAMRTNRIELGTYVLNAYGRSPWLAGMSAIDLDELSGGRLLLGIGAGNSYTNSDYQGIPQERPLRKMREYLELIRSMTTASMAERVSYRGQIHSMTSWPPQVQPVRREIPLMLAATSPRMVELAGQVADGVGLGSVLSISHIQDVVLPSLERGAEAAGRDPSTIKRYGAVFVAVDQDRERAAHAARFAVCNLYATKPHPHYDRLLRDQGYAPVADALAAATAEGDAFSVLDSIPDQLIDELTVYGDHDSCVARLSAYAEVLDRVCITNVNAWEVGGGADESASQAIIGSFQPVLALASRAR